MLSLSVWPKVITLSGFHCIIITTIRLLFVLAIFVQKFFMSRKIFKQRFKSIFVFHIDKMLSEREKITEIF